jgi:tetratricopeptide (TPR) repeat protein
MMAPPSDSEVIRAYDASGREILITKEEWRNKVLPGELQRHWNNGEGLYHKVVQALNDGFFKEVLDASMQVLRIDTNRERAYCLRAIVLMKNGLWDQSEATLQHYLKKFGPSAYVLTNLAKIYAERGEAERSHQTLLESLRMDPNQENALDWWGGIQSENGGEPAFLKAMEEIAKIPGSWRAQLWLARDLLERRDLNGALALYRDIIKLSNADGTALMQISGDLGPRGHLAEIVRLVAPVYRPEEHRIEVGFNLLQCCLELGDRHGGMALLDRILQLKRPDILHVLKNFEREFLKLPSNPTLAS